ncbi:hypothetical protein [Kribbella sp. NBC_00359]|uniref:hypothetical protein n=1 Tax=Kribbella sp. NBC_00359 TaxID=2975966 RepID=UPI002E20E104
MTSGIGVVAERLRPEDDPTMVVFGERKLRALCRAAGLGDREEEVARGYRLMSESWGERKISEPPRWSFANPDSTPVQFSIVLEDEPVSVSVSLEAQAEAGTPRAYWDAGRRLTTRLSRTYGLSLEQLEHIQDLFVPHGPGFISMAMYHAAGWRKQGPPLAKVYLGVDQDGSAALRTCEEALGRLGLGGQWSRIADQLHRDDVVSYVSLDLDTGPCGRTKVYVHHRGQLTVERLESVARLAADYVPGDLDTLVELARQSEDAARWQPGVTTRERLQWRSNRRRRWQALTYLSIGPDREQPVESAVPQLSLPTLVHNDAQAAELVRGISESFGMSGTSRAAYERCRAVFAPSPMDQEMYAHEYLSFRRVNGKPRTVVYFNPRMFLARHGLTNGDLTQGWSRFGGSGLDRSMSRNDAAKPRGWVR